MNNKFNANLQNIKRFDFRLGNAFGGIKRLAIFFNDDIKIKSNSGTLLDFEPNKERILAELKNFCFENWQLKYNDNTNPVLENAWSIELKFDNHSLEFGGLDDFPDTWQQVENFVKKYGGFTELLE